LAFTPGTRLGAYEITSQIGEGGMGVVYKAHDTRLNRPVAVKFLSNELADADARRRFQMEAQTASSLNHPHIVTVYDAGEYEGRQYLITEFIDGGTLKHWARNEKRTWRQVVDLLAGVADGLAAAHEAGILHRDIKPDNILITKGGSAKLADFGLAKLAGGQVDLTQALTRGPTQPGMIIGTIPYMSPEQASGEKLDSRSDIFSFGAVLYEMLQGRKPFEGSNNLETLQKVIHAEPQPLGDDVPPGLRMAIEKALEKDPAERYHSMRELAVDLRRLSRVRKAGQPAAPTPSRANARHLALGSTLGVFLVALALGIIYWRLLEADYFWENPLEGARFEKLTDWPGTELDAAISYDGAFVAFLSDRDGPYDMWVTQVGGGEFRNLTQGRSITLLHEMTRTTGFNADGSQLWLRSSLANQTGPNQPNQANLSLLATIGGAARPFLTPASLNPVWSQDGTMLVFHHATAGDPITLAEPDGQNEKSIYKGAAGEHNHYVTLSPDKQYIYFARNWRSTEADIWRIAVAGGVPERLTYHNSHVAYPVLLDNRTLIYRATAGDGTAWVLYGMDVERRIPHQISRGVEEFQSVAASANGRRLAVTVSNPVVSLWTVPITAQAAGESAARRVPVPAAQAQGPRHTPEGLVYLAGKGGTGGLWRWKDGSAVELWRANTGAVIAAPGVASSGALAFGVRRNGRSTLYVAAANGTGARPLAEQLDLRGSPSWSPDGTSVAVAADAGEGPMIYRVPVDGGTPERLTVRVASNPQWSPDGQMILYDDRTTGGSFFPIRGIRLDKTPATVPDFSNHGDWESFRFTPDGNVVFLQGDFRYQDFWLADLKTGEKRQLTKLKPGYSIRAFDISPDGKEILFDRVQENSDIVLIDLQR
jgi:Tol biopolymer transport system component/predicted Ser/Thr protein kinase